MQRTELTKNKLTLPFPTEPSTAFYREIALCTLNSSEFHQKKNPKNTQEKHVINYMELLAKVLRLWVVVLQHLCVTPASIRHQVSLG